MKYLIKTKKKFTGENKNIERANERDWLPYRNNPHIWVKGWQLPMIKIRSRNIQTPTWAAFVILTGRIGCKIRQRVHSIKQTWPRAQVLSSASVVWILNPTFLRYLTVFLRNHDPSCVSMRHCDGRNKKAKMRVSLDLISTQCGRLLLC